MSRRPSIRPNRAVSIPGAQIAEKKPFRKAFKPRTENQKYVMEAIEDCTVTFVKGPAGCGKTAIAVAMGVERLLAGKYKRLIICRPAVASGEDIGFLPGDVAEKLEPFLMPIYDEILNLVDHNTLNEYLNNGKTKKGENEIVIAPLGLIRGRNFHDAFIIVDEAQNCTFKQILMAVTRCGFNSKIVLVGDSEQSDLPPGASGFLTWYNRMMDSMDEVACEELEKCDIVRNAVIAKILTRLEQD